MLIICAVLIFQKGKSTTDISVCLLTERSPVRYPAAAIVVSLSKELDSYCSSPPSCIYLAIAGEANAKLCMSRLIVEVQVGLRVPTSSSTRHVQPSCGMLIPSPGGFILHRLRSACLVHRYPSLSG